MRIMFTTWAWPSHFLPMVPLAWALRSAGHDVRVAGPAPLAGVVRDSGLLFSEAGGDLDFVKVVRKVIEIGAPDADADATAWQKIRQSRGSRSLGMFVAAAGAMADGLIAFTRRWEPDLVVYDATTYAGPLAAALAGVPAVRHLFGPDLMYHGREFEPELLRPLCEKYGLDELDTSGVLAVDPCPPSLQTDGIPRRAGMRHVPYNGPGTVPDWLLEPAKRPRVCVTSGTSIPAFGEALFVLPQVVDALADLNIELVVAVKSEHRPMLGEVPAGVRVAESLPLSVLLRTCTAVVHHGGAGTLLASLAAGLPQLVVAQLPDQLYNASTLAGTGASITMVREDLKPEAIRAELARLIEEPGYRNAAERLAAEMAAQATPAEMAARVAAAAGGDAPACG